MDVKKIKFPAFYQQIGTIDHAKGEIRIGRNEMMPVSFYIFVGSSVYSFDINDAISQAVEAVLKMEYSDGGKADA